MELTFTDPGFGYMLESVMGFQSEGAEAFWSEPLFYFYPQLDRTRMHSLSPEERRDYVSGVLRQVYGEQKGVIAEKAVRYAAHWRQCRAQITAALSDAFGIDCDAILNDMTARVSLNPIEPRFLREHTFDIFYLNSERGAVGEAIHEIIHFVWFHVWNGLFGDGWEEYERPSLKWILSEMVVEPIMGDERLRTLNPYYERQEGGCIYPYFFDMRAGGKLVLDEINALYRSRDMESFMRDSFAYCREHETEIRDHIRRAETHGIQ